MNDDTAYMALAKKLVLSKLDLTKYAVFLFGSRTETRHSQFADIDIGILGSEPLPLTLRAQLIELLNESDIPFKVDVVDFYNVDANFKKIALEKRIVWNKPSCITLD